MKVVNVSYEIYLDEVDGRQITLNIEKYGRTCYKSESKSDLESAISFVQRAIKSGHHSILEHEKVTVKIICDRGISHELVRHRIGSFSQESTRYCNYSKDKFGSELTFIKPLFWDENSSEYKLWEHAMRVSETDYLNLIKIGAKPQEARSVLPNSLKTEIVITFNLREWRHFFELRALGLAGNPHPQMTEITIPMLKDFDRLIPGMFSDLVEQLNNGDVEK